MPDNVQTDTRTATEEALEDLRARLEAAAATNVGFPVATDIDYTPLAPFLRHLLNNLGDPTVDGAFPHHTKPMEREVVTIIADLLRTPAQDRWGYVTSGASEGTEQALYLARQLYPDAVVYYSQAAHHCVPNAVRRLDMVSITIRADEYGEIDYDDLAEQLGQHRSRPAVIVANIGTAMTEAVDDVRRITELLDRLAITRRWVHSDAALAGIPLALMDSDDDARPGFDFADGAHSVVVSGHKFFGVPVPCGVLVVLDSLRSFGARPATYTGSPDSTLNNSRAGFAALCLWYAIRHLGVDGHRIRAEQARSLAAQMYGQLVGINWPAFRHPHALTVTLASPPPDVVAKWALPSQGDWSHVICMPGTDKKQVENLIADLQGPPPQPISVVPAQRRLGLGKRRRSSPAASDHAT